ncbi:MAG: thiamine phosphate synthase [Sandaracinaceae bacterium]
MRPPPRLLLITALSANLAATMRATLEHADARVAVQLRDKAASPRALAEGARALLPLVRERGAALLINERIDVARAVDADGVHLPESGLSVQDARAVLEVDRLVGRSCHDSAGLETALEAGASYATLSPVGVVPGKNPPLGIEGFVAPAALPVLALGGLDAADVPALLARGAHGIAVQRAVFAARDPGAAVAAMLDVLP